MSEKKDGSKGPHCCRCAGDACNEQWLCFPCAGDLLGIGEDDE